METLGNDTASLDAIHDLLFGASKALTLKLALELDVFSAIATGRATADEVARATNASASGTSRLLDALCAMGFLHKWDGRYGLSITAEAFLVRGRASYYGDSYLDAVLPWAWPEAGPAVRAIQSGEGVGKEITDADALPLWRSWCGAHAVVWEDIADQARRLWDGLEGVVEIPRGARVLDLACGHAIWTLVLLERDPDATLTAVDRYPEVLDTAREMSERLKVASRIETMLGDILSVELPSEEYDLVYIGGILYLFSGEELVEILAKARTALRPGATLVANTLIADPGRSQAEAPLVQALRRFLYNGGNVPTFDEYRAAFAAAGFTGVAEHADDILSANSAVPV